LRRSSPVQNPQHREVRAARRARRRCPPQAEARQARHRETDRDRRQVDLALFLWWLLDRLGRGHAHPTREEDPTEHEPERDRQRDDEAGNARRTLESRARQRTSRRGLDRGGPGSRARDRPENGVGENREGPERAEQSGDDRRDRRSEQEGDRRPDDDDRPDHPDEEREPRSIRLPVETDRTTERVEPGHADGDEAGRDEQERRRQGERDEHGSQIGRGTDEPRQRQPGHRPRQEGARDLVVIAGIAMSRSAPRGESRQQAADRATGGHAKRTTTEQVGGRRVRQRSEQTEEDDNGEPAPAPTRVHGSIVPLRSRPSPRR